MMFVYVSIDIFVILNDFSIFILEIINLLQTNIEIPTPDDETEQETARMDEAVRNSDMISSSTHTSVELSKGK